MKPLPVSFFRREAKVVARDLLGHLLVHRQKGKIFIGKIVETEAYYGSNDPGSRAYNGKKNMNRWMWSAPGTIFIYNVHNNWMVNAITGRKGDPQAALIRAVEPLAGISMMKRRRETSDLHNLCSGPGKFSHAFGITPVFNGRKFCDLDCDLNFARGEAVDDTLVQRSHRIGLSRDVKEPLRFFIKNNRFVSRAKP